jgi:hypothetical protein
VDPYIGKGGPQGDCGNEASQRQQQHIRIEVGNRTVPGAAGRAEGQSLDNVNMIPVTPIEGERCNQMCHIRAAPGRGGIGGGGGVMGIEAMREKQ